MRFKKIFTVLDGKINFGGHVCSHINVRSRVRKTMILVCLTGAFIVFAV